jgi:hypothetical protein
MFRLKTRELLVVGMRLSLRLIHSSSLRSPVLDLILDATSPPVPNNNLLLALASSTAPPILSISLLVRYRLRKMRCANTTRINNKAHMNGLVPLHLHLILPPIPTPPHSALLPLHPVPQHNLQLTFATILASQRRSMRLVLLVGLARGIRGRSRIWIYCGRLVRRWRGVFRVRRLVGVKEGIDGCVSERYRKRKCNEEV